MKIEFTNLSNVAFEDNPQELSRILRKLADQLEEGEKPERLKDINGNTAGYIEY